MNEGKIPKLTNKWKNPQTIISKGDKQIVFHFENILNNQMWKPFDIFYINKTSYSNSIDLIVDYITYFIEYYDRDQELVVGYLKLKNDIDVNHKYTLDNLDDFIKDIHNILITPTIEKSLDAVIEYNNDIDIETDEDGSKKYKTSRQYAESLEFNNEHVRLMLKISYCMKIISPVMLHFFVMNRIKINENDNIIYKFFEPLMGDRFSDKINIYNKLYVYIKAKIQESRSQNGQIYEQRDIFGVDISTLTQEFLRKKLITEIMFRYDFGQNPVAFNKVFITRQLNYFVLDKYKKTPTLLSNERNSDGLSGMEKLEMNMTKLDEGITILSDLSVIAGIKDIRNRYRFDISEEEIMYMIEKHTPCEIQQGLITGFFSKFFGESRNIKLANKRQYCIMALTIKKLLLTCDANIQSDISVSFLPFIITGNLQGKQEDRPIRNNKFITKLESTPAYQSLIRNKFQAINEIRPNVIVNIISTLANSTFTYCAYEYPEMYGEKIDVDLNKLALEIITFLSAI